jgi:hypothetical protein
MTLRYFYIVVLQSYGGERKHVRMTLRYGPQYVFLMTTWHVWFAITCLSLSPWFFHPQSFKVGCCSFTPVFKPPACSA